MSTARDRILRLAMFASTLCLLCLGGAVLLLASPAADRDEPVSSPAPVPAANLAAAYNIVPAEMSLSGDVAVCGDPNLDPEVASWCGGVPTGTIILGVDPSSSDPDRWHGGQATTSIYIGGIVSPTVARLSVSWPDWEGKGIHSPTEGQVAAITWDGVPIWTKRTRDLGTTGHLYAVQHPPVLATAVLTAPLTHALSFQVPVSTAWDISSITIDLYPLGTGLRGIAYNPFRDCQNPFWGPFPIEAEIEEDIARLVHMANGLRTYSSLNTVGAIPRIANRVGLPVCAGAWLERETDSEGNPIPNRNRQEIDALIDIANTVPLECVVVGNEVLLFQSLSDEELLAYIREVKEAVDVPVTTADVPWVLRDHPDVLDELDLIMVHTYPSWVGVPIAQAVDFVVQDYLQWQQDYPHKRIIIGETGWPSDGPIRGEAVPSLENQQFFFHGFLSAAQRHGIEFYYFSAFDELWKREGGFGSHWGFSYSDRTGKHKLQSVLVPTYSIYLPLVLKNAQAAASVDSLLSPDLVATPQSISDAKFVVFDEYEAKENHFLPSGWMGDRQDLGYYECDNSNPHSGDLSIRVTYNPQGTAGWAGIYWQEPEGNWGTVEDAGYNLDRATALRFYARGENGGEKVIFLMGGIWGEYPDSQQPALSTDLITLTTGWTEHTIDLRGRDLTQVIGGFAFVTDQCLNPEPITFYLDDIYYLLSEDPGPPAPTPTPPTPYTFDVYRDKDATGNHYVPSGRWGDTGDIRINECWTEDTYAGSTAIRLEYTAQSTGPHYGCNDPLPCDWASLSWQHPAYNWGDRPGGYNLSGARGLTFRARGETGGEWISFQAGGVGCGSSLPYSDTLCPALTLNPAPVALTTTWRVYTLPLADDLDLDRVVGGFGWTALKEDNPEGAVFYLDDIQYLYNVDIPLQPRWIYYGPRLEEGYDMGVNTSGGLTDWVTDHHGYMCMAYPAGQDWGAVFITVGPPTDPPRPCKDLSAYQTLSLELRGEVGGEEVSIGLKDCKDADDGSETKIPVGPLTKTWEPYTFPLSGFATADRTKLYVVTEFVFEPGTSPETVCFRRIQYLP